MELGDWVEARPHLRSQAHCHKEAPTILIFKMFTMIVSGIKVYCQRKASPIKVQSSTLFTVSQTPASAPRLLEL